MENTNFVLVIMLMININTERRFLIKVIRNFINMLINRLIRKRLLQVIGNRAQNKIDITPVSK